MATFQKVMSAEEWGRVMDFNNKVKAETGTPIIDMSTLNDVRKAYIARAEAGEDIVAAITTPPANPSEDEEEETPVEPIENTPEAVAEPIVVEA